MNVQRLVTKMAIELNELGRNVEVNFRVDDELADAIAALPGAEITEAVYVPNKDAPYVIRMVETTIGRIRLSAQNHDRPATSAELEAAGGWHEHEDSYRSATLRRAP